MSQLTALQNNTLLALDTIRAHKMRTLLTMLGVVIGTGTIIGVGAILTGFDGAVTNVIRSLGPNTIVVSRTPAFQTTDLSPEQRARKQLQYLDGDAIRAGCPACARVSAMLWPNHFPIVSKYKGNAVYQTQLRGAEPSFADMGQMDINQGRFYTAFEDRHHEPVAVIGADVQKSLFGEENPIGKEITVDGEQFQVIGTLFRPNATFFDSSDNRVFVPFFSMKKAYPNAQDMAFFITAEDGRIPEAMDEVRATLRIQRHVKPAKLDDFDLSTAAQMVEQFRQITAMTFLVMIVLSSIGLLVGGIGVMNIMLVSVTERTREIGIRLAIGATEADIQFQFLSEAIAISLLGGAIGVLTGIGGASLFQNILHWQIRLTPQLLVFSGCFAAVVGMFFGYYPSRKASQLNPIDALRYEQ